MPSTTITDVHTVGIYVSDQEAAVRFFVDRLGFEKRLDAPIGPGMRWIEVAPRGASTSIALTLTEEPVEAAADTGIRFMVPDTYAEHTAMTERGVNVSEVLRLEGAPAMYTFDDPDRNRFYVVEEPR
jgi:catechol 2,3-dioxygenase-like lactoylglutathione lyase family enzyme